MQKGLWRVLRSGMVVLLIGGVVVYGYRKLLMDEQAKLIAELEQMKAQLEEKLAQREAMIERLSQSSRIAHVVIKDQAIDGESGSVESTDLELIELDERGSELARQTFTIPGEMLFIDGWTVKFDEGAVAAGDPLRGRTLLLLRRVYSEQMRPVDGFEIDTPGAAPPAYAAEDAGRFEQQIWSNFWSIAGDAQTAKQFGVRVAQGEAVYKPVRTGQVYALRLDADAGISLAPLGATEVVVGE